MKNTKFFWAAVLLLGFYCPAAEAQLLLPLHSFTPISPNAGDFYTNSDGANPAAGLLLSGDTLYGTATYGGSSGQGTVFSLSTNGSNFRILHDFTNGADGTAPTASLILSGSTLYGTASFGGASSGGTVFSVSTNGKSFKTLYAFTNGSDGAIPNAGLVLSGNTLYGTALGAGYLYNGTVFAVNTGGTGFQTLYTFTNGSDGSTPQAGLILSGDTLYGTASSGGYQGTNGTVFALNTEGTVFQTLYAFTNGSDGSIPLASLILSGNTLYGTASSGGYQGTNGTVFSLSTNGSNFKTVYAFTNGSDGSVPLANLILSGNTLYGTASQGANTDAEIASGGGVVFSVNTNGANFTTVHAFTGGNDGYDPVAGLILSGNTLYGTAFLGGISGEGTVFALHAFAGQSFTTLYTESDGSSPDTGLILSGGTLYGTTASGGDDSMGSVFSLSTNGAGYTRLYSFTGGNDGSQPQANLLLSGSTLYGTAVFGGAGSYGSIFSLGTNNENVLSFATVYEFTNGFDGDFPEAGLILSGNTLYGTTAGAYWDSDLNVYGYGTNGTVFSLNTNGTEFTTVYAFTGGLDGAGPLGSLVLSGNTLYGTASAGGISGNGTVFAATTDGMDFKTLYAFTNGSDGAHPVAGLVLAGSTLYGTASSGGYQGTNGTVFSLNANGTGFKTLYAFTNGTDGSAPMAGLILSGDTLYGTASAGGISGNGTIFSLNTNGTAFTILYDFFGGTDGSGPLAGLVLSGNTLYSDDGYVYALNLGSSAVVPIALNILPLGHSVVLTWNDPSAAFSLQATGDIAGGFTNVPGAASPFTNLTSGSAQYFRLMAQP